MALGNCRRVVMALKNVEVRANPDALRIVRRATFHRRFRQDVLGRYRASAMESVGLARCFCPFAILSCHTQQLTGLQSVTR